MRERATIHVSIDLIVIHFSCVNLMHLMMMMTTTTMIYVHRHDHFFLREIEEIIDKNIFFLISRANGKLFVMMCVRDGMRYIVHTISTLRFNHQQEREWKNDEIEALIIS